MNRSSSSSREPTPALYDLLNCNRNISTQNGFSMSRTYAHGHNVNNTIPTEETSSHSITDWNRIIAHCRSHPEDARYVEPRNGWSPLIKAVTLQSPFLLLGRFGLRFQLQLCSRIVVGRLLCIMPLIVMGA